MEVETFYSNYHGGLAEVILSDKQEVLFHSEFQTSVNLKVGEELLYISSPYFQVPPFGMMVSQNVMAKLMSTFKTASLSMSNGLLVINNATLSLKESKRVVTQINQKSLSSKINLAIFTPFVEQSAIGKAFMDGTFAKVVSGLLGYGPGLTPSGDDFIVGLLAVNSRSSFLSKQVLSIIENGIKQKHTTDVSIAYLKAALVGEFSTAVVEVIRALDEEEYLLRALYLLSKTGHSSGNDTIAGIYYALVNSKN